MLHFDATKLKTECYLSLARFKSDIMVSLDKDASKTETENLRKLNVEKILEAQGRE